MENTKREKKEVVEAMELGVVAEILFSSSCRVILFLLLGWKGVEWWWEVDGRLIYGGLCGGNGEIEWI